MIHTVVRLKLHAQIMHTYTHTHIQSPRLTCLSCWTAYATSEAVPPARDRPSPPWLPCELDQASTTRYSASISLPFCTTILHNVSNQHCGSMGSQYSSVYRSYLIIEEYVSVIPRLKDGVEPGIYSYDSMVEKLNCAWTRHQLKVADLHFL